jgi:hypothetical protein
MGLRGDRPARSAYRAGHGTYGPAHSTYRQGDSAYGPEYSASDVAADLARRERSAGAGRLGCGLRLVLGCAGVLLGAGVLAVAVLWWGLAHRPHPDARPVKGPGAYRTAPIGPAMERTRTALAAADADHRLTDDEIDRATGQRVPLLITHGTSRALIIVADGPAPAARCVAFTAYGDGRVTGRVSPCPARHPATVRRTTATAPATTG